MSELSDKIDKVIAKYEVPKEFFGAVWEAFEEGADWGFWKAVNGVVIPQVIKLTHPPKDDK